MNGRKRLLAGVGGWLWKRGGRKSGKRRAGRAPEEPMGSMGAEGSRHFRRGVRFASKNVERKFPSYPELAPRERAIWGSWSGTGRKPAGGRRRGAPSA